MTALLEPSLSFWTVLVILFLAAALLAAMWAATARREPLIAAIIALAMIPSLWLIERLVVTDREVIEATLHEIAADVKSNNRAAVLSHIDPDATWLLTRAKGELGNYEFTDCKVNKLHGIVVNYRQRPLTAVADFNVHVAGTFRVNNETFPEGDYFRRVELHLRRNADGRWLVENYSHRSPIPGRREDSVGEPDDSLIKP